MITTSRVRHILLCSLRSRYMSLRINLKNILGQAKRQSRYRTSSFMSLRINLKNIPHEEVFRGMQIL